MTNEPRNALSEAVLPQHAALLRDSAISEAVAAERGYRSVTVKSDLRNRGFSDRQCRVPTLLIPIWNVFGEIATYQIRPDVPRAGRDGRSIKYETVAGSQMVLDVPPRVRGQLADQRIPLFLTEGARKADSAVSKDLCCVDVLGVWSWRRTNAHGGKVALPEFEQMALNDRAVYLAFDSDVMTKPQVYAALSRFKQYLEAHGARVFVIYLPSGEGGAKVGLDDFLAAGHGVDDLLALATPELRQPPHDGTQNDSPYAATPTGIVYRKPTQNGAIDQLLSNFTAQIVEEVIADDGASERGELVIAGELTGGIPLPRITVPLARFAALDWPVRQWGPRAIVSAGLGTKDRLREAIQRLSPDVPRRRIYEHSGWRELPEVGWCFLHAGGAIGAQGAVAGVDVVLRGAAGRIVVPDPPSGGERREAVRASLALLELAPDGITATLLAVVYRSVLCEFVPADLSVFLVGPSGVFKSELAALAMQHVGAGFDRLHLPGQWAATANFLERIIFDFKDAPLVIDDFAPTGSPTDVSRLHATADRVLRGVGNRGGRGRMNADGSLRPNFHPRGLVIGTGEDAPRGQSLRARMVIVEVGPGDVDIERLSAAQEAGRNGVLVAGLAGYLQWIALHVEDLRKRLPTLLSEFRVQAHTTGSHARTPEAVASLALGWWAFLHFAVDVEALTHDQAETLFARVWQALGDAATGQARHQASEEPAQRFIELLSSALAAGYAHIASSTGEVPSNSGSWGWRKTTLGTGLYERTEWTPQGIRTGWLYENNLYLDLEAALTAVQKVGQATGSPIGVTSRTLAKRLHERGFLASTEQAQGELQVRRTLEGRRRRVLHLFANTIALGESGQSGQSDPPDADGAAARRIVLSNGRIVWPDADAEEWESGHDIRPNDAEPSERGRAGGIGRVAENGKDSLPNSSPRTQSPPVDPAGVVVE